MSYELKDGDYVRVISIKDRPIPSVGSKCRVKVDNEDGSLLANVYGDIWFMLNKKSDGTYTTNLNDIVFKKVTDDSFNEGDRVPKLPKRGSDLTRQVFETKKFVKVWVSDKSDDDAREDAFAVVLHNMYGGRFIDVQGKEWKYAVMFDDYGNEVTGE